MNNNNINLGITFVYDNTEYLASIYTNEIDGQKCPFGVDINTIKNAINSRIVDLFKSNQIKELYNGQIIEVKTVEAFIFPQRNNLLAKYEHIQICISI